MRRTVPAILCLAVLWLTLATAQTQQSKAQPKPAPKPAAQAPAKTAPAQKASQTAARKAPAASAHKSTTASSGAKKGGSSTASARGKNTSRRPAVTWRNRQTVPSADRYKEIQSALVSRGYLNAEEANGVWGPASIDAMKRFQAEQNIESTGKINSLSLIALGLGPKHEAAVIPPKPAEIPAPDRQPR